MACGAKLRHSGRASHLSPHPSGCAIPEMASIRPLLIFDLDGARFGLDATLVRESVWLPELTPVEEAPPYIAGIFSLRGQIVPVSDLSLRFGHPARPYCISDQIVVLELDQLLIGLIVSEVREVIEVSLDAIKPPPKFDSEAHAHLVEGEVRVGDDIVTLLDARQLVHQPSPLPNPPPRFAQGRELQLLPPQAGEGRDGGVHPSSSLAGETPNIPPPPLAGEGWGGGKHFCPQATPEERAIFHERAKSLMETAEEEAGARLPLAVIGLGGEYFGIELEAVQEFCDIVSPSPIPCCPPHILGAISLRGNLFTLLDLRAALNLPRAAQGGSKVVVAHASVRLGKAVGVAVDEVHDVVYLREEALQAAPQALRDQHGAEIKGAAPYGGKMMAVLDLPALLAREEWIVNESV
jgi:purine-binding chemotaxis protein CheW